MRWVRRSLQPAGQLARDEELRHRHQSVEERTYAEDLQQDEDHASRGVVRGLDRAERRHRVERQHEPVSDRVVLDERQRDRAGDDDDRERDQQDRQPALEAAGLAAQTRALFERGVTAVELVVIGQASVVVGLAREDLVAPV